MNRIIINLAAFSMLATSITLNSNSSMKNNNALPINVDYTYYFSKTHTTGGDTQIEGGKILPLFNFRKTGSGDTTWSTFVKAYNKLTFNDGSYINNIIFEPVKLSKDWTRGSYKLSDIGTDNKLATKEYFWSLNGVAGFFQTLTKIYFWHDNENIYLTWSTAYSGIYSVDVLGSWYTSFYKYNFYININNFVIT